MDASSIGVRVHRLRADALCRFEPGRPTLLLVLTGRGVCCSGGHAVNLTEDAVVVSQNHAEVRAQSAMVLLSVESSAGTSLDSAVLSPERIARTPTLSLLAELLRVETAESKSRNEPLVAALAKSFALYLERAVTSGYALHQRPLQTQVGDAQVLQAMTLMQGDPAKRWTVERLARAVGLSRPVFARRFASAARMTPLRYLTRTRMELAAELLRDSEAGLAAIALKVGYDSEFAFSRAFKRHHGLPPGLFRRQSAPSGSIVMRSAA